MKMNDIKYIPAGELQNGDTLRLTFMGGSEDCDVRDLRIDDFDIVYFTTWNHVAGTIYHNIRADEEVRIVI